MEIREHRLEQLRQLSAALESRGFAVGLVSAVANPFLKVANAGQPTLNERVHCEQADDGSWTFWWPWKQPIGPAADLNAVIGKIAAVLRSVDEA
jgi:hypothetical protein